MLLAALALAGAVSAAVPAPSAAEVRNPLDGPFEATLVPGVEKEEAVQCAKRELDELVSLARGRYLLSLYVQSPDGNEQRADFEFKVESAAKFRWADCVKRDPGGRWRYSHVTVIDQHGVRAPRLVRAPQSIPDAGAGRYQVRSTIERTGDLPNPEPPKKSPPKKKPPKKKPPKPSPSPPQGGQTRCEGPVPHRGKNVSYCPDWAPAGERGIPVRKAPRANAEVVDYIDPAGDDWYECHRRMEKAFTLRPQGFRNNWWAYTLGDGLGKFGRKAEGWVSETYFQGGGNQPAANLQECTS